MYVSPHPADSGGLAVVSGRFDKADLGHQRVQCRVPVEVGRLGGHREVRAVHDICRDNGIAVWCGGMLETGIGRAHNVALSTLPNFRLPGDVSASKRYWKQDIIRPAVEITPRGTIEVRDDPGFGYSLDHDYIRSITVREETIA